MRWIFTNQPTNEYVHKLIWWGKTILYSYYKNKQHSKIYLSTKPQLACQIFLKNVVWEFCPKISRSSVLWNHFVHYHLANVQDLYNMKMDEYTRRTYKHNKLSQTKSNCSSGVSRFILFSLFHSPKFGRPTHNNVRANQ